MLKKIQILLNALMNYNILYYIENVIIIKPIMLAFINFILFLFLLIECKNNNL